jgi:hypothetical protein
LAYLELFMEPQEQQVWKVLIGRSKSILAMWKDVPHLGQESPPSSMMALYGFESSPWERLAHLYWFFFGYYKWLSWATHSYDWCKQVKFHSHYSLLFQWWPLYFIMQLLCGITNLLVCRFIEMDHVKPSSVHVFFHIQSIDMIPLH